MKSKWIFSQTRAGLTAILFASAIMLSPSTARAQSIDNCNSGVLDNNNGVEESICIYGDTDYMYFTAEVDNNSGSNGCCNNTYSEGVGIDAQLWEDLSGSSGTLVWDSGEQSGEASGYESAEADTLPPVAGLMYLVNTTYNEYLCQCNDTSCGLNCAWAGNSAGLAVQGQAPSAPNGFTAWQNMECWGLSGYPGSQNYTNYPKWGWTNTNSNGTCLDAPAQTGTTTGGGGTFSCTQQNDISGTGPCGSLETSDGPPDTGTTELNVLDSLNVCGNGTNTTCPSTIGNMELDVQFYIPQETADTYQALEFDPDVTWEDSTDTLYSHKISVSCEFHPTNDSTNNPSGNPEWEYWDSSADTWYPFGNLGYSGYIPCSISPGRHRLQLYATVDTADHQYYYQEMIVDNFPNNPQNPLFDQQLGPVTACDTTDSSGPCYEFAQYVGVEQQVDNNTSASSSPQCDANSSTTICAYYDNYSLVVW